MAVPSSPAPTFNCQNNSARGLLKHHLNATSTALLVGLMIATSPAYAQTGGFAIDRFQPAETGSDWFSTDSLDRRGNGRLGFGLTLDWAFKPLVAYDSEGDEAAVLIRHQAFTHLAAGANLWDRVRISGSLPVLFFQKANAVDVAEGTLDAAEGAAIGDLRIGADVLLFGEYRQPVSMAVSGWLFLPTGNRDSFSSDETLRFSPRMTVAGDISEIAYSAYTGFLLRRLHSNFAGEPFGTEWHAGGAVGVRLLEDRLLIGPELWTSTVVSDSGNGFFDQEATPLEGTLGGHYRWDNGWGLSVGAGPGLSRGFGAPEIRWLARVQKSPELTQSPPESTDTDGDGIYDKDDACPQVAGPSHKNASLRGCPVPNDSDGDGIIDAEDACPEVAGEPNVDSSQHGCPPRPADADGDGVIDAEDACPEKSGVASEEPAQHGCPAVVDQDQDSILDDADACPDVKGPADDDPTKHGCPKARLVGTEVKILERIEFDTAKATIRPESERVLRAVAQVLVDHPGITKMRIEGHTDDRGDRWYNLKLSQDRARSVKELLIAEGIDPNRLTSEGFGPDQPVDDNGTEIGRQNNRRVEFHIVESQQNTGLEQPQQL